MKKNNKASVPLIVLSTLVVACMAFFVVSGTLAKFTSTASAQSGSVPAAQFNFNEVFNEDTGRFEQITWQMPDLGASVNPNYSEKIFYPGAYGDFSFDVEFISDVPATALAEVDFLNETGAFQSTVVYRIDADTTVPLRDLISLRFIIKTVDNDVAVTVPTAQEFEDNGIKISEFEANLKDTLEKAVGINDNKYNRNDFPNLGVQVSKDVHVFWNWEYEIDAQTNAMDTLFGNYVAEFLKSDPSVNSVLGLDVRMTVTQDEVSSANGLANAADYISNNPADAVDDGGCIVLDYIEGAEYGYRLAGSDDPIAWQDSNIFTGLQPGEKYIFYIRMPGSEDIIATFEAYTSPDPDVVVVDYINEQITCDSAYTISIYFNDNLSSAGTSSFISNIIPDAGAQATSDLLVKVQVSGDPNAIAAWTKVTIPTRPVAPVVAPVLTSKNANSITIVASDTFEYCIQDDGGVLDVAWVSCGAGETSYTFSGLTTATDYYISCRTKATASTLHSAACESELSVTTD